MSLRKILGSTSNLSLSIAILGILIGVILGLMAVAVPTYLIITLVALVAIYFFINSFEKAILGILVMRSSLDVFSDQQLPAILAISIDLITLIYIAKLFLSKQKIQLDGFGYFFAVWIVLQGLWVVLLPLGGLGLDTSVLPVSIREWVRLFSLFMCYLLIMQFRDRLHPEKVISALFLSLVIPLTTALLQIVFPPSMLPSFLVFERGYSIEAGSRINGTLGHPNVFATFTLLFLGLTLWKIANSQQRKYWIILLGILAFFLASTTSLTGMLMLISFVLVYFIFKANVVNLIAGLSLLTIIIAFFVSSDLGAERLQSLYGTPLLNPDIDWSRAVLLQWDDGNSFNWRIAQWTYLLQSWQKYPIWGYGLGTAEEISVFNTIAHNDYIRFLVEQGVVGFILFLAFIGAHLVRLIQLLFSVSWTSPQRDLYVVMLAYFMAILVGMLTGNLLVHTTVFFYWWTLMAITGWSWTPLSKVEAREY